MHWIIFGPLSGLMPNVQNLCLNAPPNQRISKIHKMDRKVSLWSAFKGRTYPGVSRISAWADLADVCQPARLQFAGAGCIPWCLRFGWRSFGYRKEQINIEGTTKNKVHIMLLRSKTWVASVAFAPCYRDFTAINWHPGTESGSARSSPAYLLGICKVASQAWNAGNVRSRDQDTEAAVMKIQFLN